jgi:hypothetical protein
MSSNNDINFMVVFTVCSCKKAIYFGKESLNVQQPRITAARIFKH